MNVNVNTRLGDFDSLGSQEGKKYSTEEVTTATVAEVKSHSPSESLPRVDLSQSAVTDEHRQQLEVLRPSDSDVFSAHDQDYGRTSVNTVSEQEMLHPADRDRQAGSTAPFSRHY